MSSRSGEASCELLCFVYVYVYLSEQEMAETERERLEMMQPLYLLCSRQRWLASRALCRRVVVDRAVVRQSVGRSVRRCCLYVYRSTLCVSQLLCTRASLPSYAAPPAPAPPLPPWSSSVQPTMNTSQPGQQSRLSHNHCAVV